MTPDPVASQGESLGKREAVGTVGPAETAEPAQTAQPADPSDPADPASTPAAVGNGGASESADRRTNKSSGATAPGDMGGNADAPSRTIPTALAIIAAIAATTFGTLWATDNSAEELAALQTNLTTDEAAEHAAATYALNVSQVNPTDIESWRRQLQSEVTPDLAPKLSAAVDVVGPWLTQMEYTSTAKVLAAKVTSRENDLYTVQVFVDMTSKSRQTPDGVTATAAYTVTLDRAANWTITDVGGVTPALPR